MNWQLIADHWQYLTGGLGLVAVFRGIYWLAVNVAVAPWERDQLRAQIKILETRIVQLEQIVRDMESSGPSNGGSSNARAKTRTSIPRKRRSSSASTASSNARRRAAISAGT